MVDNGVLCSMSRPGKVWDNAATESFFSSLKTERIGKKVVYRTRDDARADVFDYVSGSTTPSGDTRRSAYLSPVEFEKKMGVT
jgi:putative transposase